MILLLMAALAATEPPKLIPIMPYLWITAHDWPVDAYVQPSRVSVAVALDVKQDGTVDKCAVTSASNSSLDKATCKLLLDRARFQPYFDQSANSLRSFRFTVVWQPPVHGPHEQWAQMRIDVDKQGYPTKCAVIDSNIRDRERRFWYCHAITTDWHMEPLVKDGFPVAGSVIRRVAFPSR